MSVKIYNASCLSQLERKTVNHVTNMVKNIFLGSDIELLEVCHYSNEITIGLKFLFTFYNGIKKYNIQYVYVNDILHMPSNIIIEQIVKNVSDKYSNLKLEMMSRNSISKIKNQKLLLL